MGGNGPRPPLAAVHLHRAEVLAVDAGKRANTPSESSYLICLSFDPVWEGPGVMLAGATVNTATFSDATGDGNVAPQGCTGLDIE